MLRESLGELLRVGRLHVDTSVEPLDELFRPARARFDAAVKLLHEPLRLGAAGAKTDVEVIQPLNDFAIDVGTAGEVVLHGTDLPDLGRRRLGLDLCRDTTTLQAIEAVMAADIADIADGALVGTGYGRLADPGSALSADQVPEPCQ